MHGGTFLLLIFAKNYLEMLLRKVNYSHTIFFRIASVICILPLGLYN